MTNASGLLEKGVREELTQLHRLFWALDENKAGALRGPGMYDAWKACSHILRDKKRVNVEYPMSEAEKYLEILENIAKTGRALQIDHASDCGVRKVATALQGCTCSAQPFLAAMGELDARIKQAAA